MARTKQQTPQATDDLTRMIAVRAYELWTQDGRRNGNDISHWLQAEREIRQAQRTNSVKTPSR